MISVNNVYAGYGKEQVLKGINLKIEKGEITTIIGPNGCGKSTLLKCMAKQMPVTNGDITILDKSIHQITIKEFAKIVSFLKQTRDVPMISAESLVLHGRFPYMGFPRKVTETDKIIARNAMHRVGVWDIRHKMISELSGGENQKVYIAMALAQNAEVLLLDEPTAYLDIKYQLELLDLICELKAESKTIVVVLHDINSAIKISDRICVINNMGEIAFNGEPKELVNSGIIESVFDVLTTCVEIDGKIEMFFKVKHKI